MAKENRFPSQANKSKAVKKEQDKVAPVVGVKPALVKIQYNKKNHHIISMHHHLAEGINHVPAKEWAEAKKHPAIQQLLKDKHAVELDVQPEAEDLEESKESDESQAEDASKEDAGE